MKKFKVSKEEFKRVIEHWMELGIVPDKFELSGEEITDISYVCSRGSHKQCFGCSCTCHSKEKECPHLQAHIGGDKHWYCDSCLKDITSVSKKPELPPLPTEIDEPMDCACSRSSECAFHSMLSRNLAHDVNMLIRYLRALKERE